MILLTQIYTSILIRYFFVALITIKPFSTIKTDQYLLS